jgi:hypothetical protein
MAPSVDVAANFSSFRVFVCPTSSFLDVTLFRRLFPRPMEYNLLHTVETSSLLLPVVFHLFMLHWHTSVMTMPWFCGILTAYVPCFLYPNLDIKGGT